MTELLYVAAGDKIVDNDPRKRGRTLTVLRTSGRYVWAADSQQKERRLLLNRIYTDGKPRRTGFSVVGAHPVNGRDGVCLADASSEAVKPLASSRRNEKE